jgi:sulfotransferase
MQYSYYFLSGLPRSGSTLLRSILNQNPELYSGPISPSVELLYYTDKYFQTSEMLLASPNPQGCYDVLSNIMDNFYRNIMEREGKSKIIEFNRAIPNNIERFRTYIKEDVKIVCPVRSIPEILASFISLIHRNSDKVSFVDQYLIDNKIEVNDDNRCDYLMSDYGIVGQALFAMSRPFIRGEEGLLKIVEYENLINDTNKIMEEIYDFWGLERYQHEYTNLENKYPENDIFQYNLDGMHTVAKTIKKRSKPPEEVLSTSIIEKYSGMEYWRPDCSNDYYLRLS